MAGLTKLRALLLGRCTKSSTAICISRDSACAASGSVNDQHRKHPLQMHCDQDQFHTLVVQGHAIGAARSDFHRVKNDGQTSAPGGLLPKMRARCRSQHVAEIFLSSMKCATTKFFLLHVYIATLLHGHSCLFTGAVRLSPAWHCHEPTLGQYRVHQSCGWMKMPASKHCSHALRCAGQGHCWSGLCMSSRQLSSKQSSLWSARLARPAQLRSAPHKSEGAGMPCKLRLQTSSAR